MKRSEIRRRQEALHLRLAEAQINLYTDLGLLDPRDFQADLDGWGTYPAMTPPYYRQSQKRGEVLPVYTNETQLRVIRDRSRKLVAENEFAICAVENRRSYVVGKGLVYRAVPLRPDCPPALVKQVQELIRVFCAANELPAIESDTMLRLDRDGEALLRFFELPSGLVTVRPVEPEHLRSPIGDSYGAEYSFGVQTLADDIQTRQGYWIVEQPMVNDLPSFAPANEIEHLTLNTDRSAKRGLPTFYAVEANLRRADDLLASMSTMAKTRAKIAMIRKMKGIASNAAKALTDSLAKVTATDNVTGNATNMEQFRWATILNSTDQIDYEFPSADVAASDFIAVLEADVGAVASRLCMPDWMLLAHTGDASFAAGLIAEAPSTKMFERLQQLFKNRFGESWYPGKESVIWRQLRSAIRRGVLPRDLDRWIEIQVECPALVVRDKAQESSVNKTYLDAKIKSPQTIQQEQGLDSEQEARNWVEWDKDHPQQQMQPGPFGQVQTPAPGGEQPPQPDEGEERPSGPGGPPMTESERLFESQLRESGFTGTIKDKRGRQLHYQDGKRVKAPQAPVAPGARKAHEAQGKRLQAAHAKAHLAHQAASKEHKGLAKAHSQTGQAHAKAKFKHTVTRVKLDKAKQGAKDAQKMATQAARVAKKKTATAAEKAAAKKLDARAKVAAAKHTAAIQAHAAARTAATNAVAQHKPNAAKLKRAAGKLSRAKDKLLAAKDALIVHQSGGPLPPTPTPTPAPEPIKIAPPDEDDGLTIVDDDGEPLRPAVTPEQVARANENLDQARVHLEAATQEKTKAEGLVASLETQIRDTGKEARRLRKYADDATWTANKRAEEAKNAKGHWKERMKQNAQEAADIAGRAQDAARAKEGEHLDLTQQLAPARKSAANAKIEHAAALKKHAQAQDAFDGLVSGAVVNDTTGPGVNYPKTPGKTAPGEDEIVTVAEPPGPKKEPKWLRDPNKPYQAGQWQASRGQFLKDTATELGGRLAKGEKLSLAGGVVQGSPEVPPINPQTGLRQQSPGGKVEALTLEPGDSLVLTRSKGDTHPSGVDVVRVDGSRQPIPERALARIADRLKVPSYAAYDQDLHRALAHNDALPAAVRDQHPHLRDRRVHESLSDWYGRCREWRTCLRLDLSVEPLIEAERQYAASLKE